MTLWDISSIVEHLLIEHFEEHEDSTSPRVQPILDRWTLRCENEIAESLRYGTPLPPYLKRSTIVSYRPSPKILG